VSDQEQSHSLRITWAETDDEIRACLPVLRELRRYIGQDGDFVARIRNMQQTGYRLAAVWDGDRLVACAGYQIVENLIRGRYLHVHELVTARQVRSTGIGQRLLQALIREARQLECQALALECGLRNARAHRFYFREGMRISALRFAINLESVANDE